MPIDVLVVIFALVGIAVTGHVALTFFRTGIVPFAPDEMATIRKRNPIFFWAYILAVSLMPPLFAYIIVMTARPYF
ncbi:MAG: hypothetical protein NW206_16495 [Hyphomonadaceae bacterium]|nr:hypothetical protein [Hyphomonadaceae bacterium]